MIAPPSSPCLGKSRLAEIPPPPTTKHTYTYTHTPHTAPVSTLLTHFLQETQCQGRCQWLGRRAVPGEHPIVGPKLWASGQSHCFETQPLPSVLLPSPPPPPQCPRPCLPDLFLCTSPTPGSLTLEHIPGLFFPFLFSCAQNTPLPRASLYSAIPQSSTQ